MRRRQNADTSASPGRLCRGFAPLGAVVAVAAALLAGCGRPQPYVSDTRLSRGLVVVLPGIEGRSPFNEAICEGLNDGGVDWAIELHDWTSAWLGPIGNLRAEQRNRRKASELADRVQRYRMAYPGRPVVLVGQSGGGAIAVWTIEALPPGQNVKGAVLLAAAMSPQYMLDEALRRAEEGLVSFHSQRDWLFLGVGTATQGTMDRQFLSSAGRVGFNRPDSPLRQRLYDKLYEIAWQPSMAQTGYEGTHLSSGASRFVAAYVAPLVLAHGWDADLIERVQAPRGAPE
ncbi:MAG: hypothetical protein KGY99_01760 [Phycisphaerae bacterium]|nr:hypothetical protein [Phycisphaerae bacterium]